MLQPSVLLVKFSLQSPQGNEDSENSSRFVYELLGAAGHFVTVDNFLCVDKVQVYDE